MNLDNLNVHNEEDIYYVDDGEVMYEVEVIFYSEDANGSVLRNGKGLAKDEVEQILLKVDRYIKDNTEPSEDERMDNFIERTNIEDIYR